MSSDMSVSEILAKSPENGEADMEMDDPDSHLGAILAVAEDLSRQSVNEVTYLQPDKDGSGDALKKVISTIGSWSTGIRSSSNETQTMRHTGVEKGDITPPTLNGGSAAAESVDQTTTQVPSRSHGQKSDDRANDEGVDEDEDRCPLPAKLASVSRSGSSHLLLDEPLREQRSTAQEPQPSSTMDQIAVDPDSGEADTGNGDQLDTSKGNQLNAEVAAIGNLQGAVPTVVGRYSAPVKETPSRSNLQEPGATAQSTLAATIKESVALSPSPVESHVRRSTRSSMGLLKKKSYAESSGDERTSRPNYISGSKGAGGQTAKQKRNDTGGRVHPSTTGTKTSKFVPNSDKSSVTVAPTASASTPKPVGTMPDWEVQLRKMPNWELELEMWKERELFRYSTTGIIFCFRVLDLLTSWKAIGTIAPSK
jgi:hypothetical protein